MSVYLKLVELYGGYGYTVRTGLYPSHFHNFKGAAGTVLEKSSLKIRTGGGIALGEVYLLEELCAVIQPKRIFIIGNAFGWSTFAFALACPSARILALDAGIEGNDNMAGIDLTNQIARDQGYQVNCVHGFSPQDVPKTISAEFQEQPDLIFIDGLHTDKQLKMDFEASHAAAPNALYLYHDIVNFKMHAAFDKISTQLAPTHKSTILWRTYSGMGISIPHQLAPQFEKVLNAYTDDPAYINTIRFRWRLLKLKALLGPVGTLIEKLAARFDNTLQRITKS